MACSLVFSGVYKDCEIEFTMSLKNYPAVAPRLLAKSHIVHPNIDYYTYDNYPYVCLNVLTDWGSYDSELTEVDQKSLFSNALTNT